MGSRLASCSACTGFWVVCLKSRLLFAALSCISTASRCIALVSVASILHLAKGSFSFRLQYSVMNDDGD